MSVSREHDSTRGDEHATPHGEILVDVPHRFAPCGIPGIHTAAFSTGARVHLHTRTDVGRPGDVVGLQPFVIHAVVGVGEVKPSRRRRERARRLVLATGRRRADSMRDDDFPGAVRRILHRPSGAKIDAVGPVREHELLGRDHFTRLPIERVDESVAVGMHQDFALPAVYLDVGEDVLVDAIIIPGVVRRHLIGPARLAVVRIAREDRHRPLVVAGAHVRIPHAGIGGAVVDEIERGIVGDPTPHRSPAELPLLPRPRCDAEVGAAVIGIKRLERRADQHITVRSDRVGAPQLFAVPGIERENPAPYSQLGATVADDHFVLHDQRGHRHRLTDVDVPHLDVPDLFPGGGIDGHGVGIQRVVVDAAVREGGATVDDVATRDADRTIAGTRLVHPLHRAAGLGEIDRVEDVGIRRHDVHRVIDDERIALVAVQDAGGKRAGHLQLRHVAGRDLRQRRIPCRGIVAAGLGPFLAGGRDDHAPAPAPACGAIRPRRLRGSIGSRRPVRLARAKNGEQQQSAGEYFGPVRCTWRATHSTPTLTARTA